jgi:ATP-binding cassette subfamily B protein
MSFSIRGATASIGKLFVTLGHVIALNWQVSPTMYVLQVIFNFIGGISTLVTAYLTGLLTGELFTAVTNPSLNHQNLYLVAILLVATGYIFNQLNSLGDYLSDLNYIKFDSHTQLALMRKFSELDQSYYEDSAFNAKLNKVNQNLFALRNMNESFFNLLQSTVSVTATGIALFILAPLLGGLMILALIPILVIEVRANKKRWRIWDEKGDEQRLQFFTRGSLLDGEKLKEIKLYGLVDFMLGRWRQYFESFRRSHLQVMRTAQIHRSVSGLLDGAVQIGAQLWLLERVLTPGSKFGIGQFVYYRQIISNFAFAGRAMVRSLHFMQERSLYVNDYFEIMNIKPRLESPANGLVLPKKLPRITFESVSFSYPETTKLILDNVSFTIEQGEDVALVGANGAGKSTLIKLLLRLYDPTVGRILIDDHDLRDINLASWYNQIGVLFQDFAQFNYYTARDTVTMGRINAGDSRDKRLKLALADSGASEFVNKFNLGLEQRLNKSFKDGIQLSGGQWQRLALARAFYRQANLLILDEPTSAIDAKGEYEIFERIAETQADKSSLIVSHRFSTVRKADRIMVLEDGRIIENGSHESLMKIKNGTYRELFNLQAEAYK